MLIRISSKVYATSIYSMLVGMKNGTVTLEDTLSVAPSIAQLVEQRTVGTEDTLSISYKTAPWYLPK